MAWTTPVDQTTGHLVTATEYNQQVIDNLKYLHGDSSTDVRVNPTGIGYQAGAGGTVTQATSRTTTVTLNTATGQITLNNATSAVGTTYTFSVLNSLVTSTDNILVTPGTNWAANWNGIRCVSVGTGIFALQYTAQSIDTTALLVNFAVIKGATS